MPEPDPENDAGYPAGSGSCQISGWFLGAMEGTEGEEAENKKMRESAMGGRGGREWEGQGRPRRR